MAASGTATGLQGIGAIAGLLGTALGGIRDEERLKKQARGQETAAQRRLRSSLAAQNEQSAMRVANSQPGVNPALAQRNAQQALAQAQVGTNANLAQLAVGQQQRAQEQLAAQRKQRIQGAVSAGTGLLNSLGGSLSVQAAQQEQAAAKQQALDAQAADQKAAVAASQGAQGFKPVLDPEEIMRSKGLVQDAPVAETVPVVDTAGTEVARGGVFPEQTAEDLQIQQLADAAANPPGQEQIDQANVEAASQAVQALPDPDIQALADAAATISMQEAPQFVEQVAAERGPYAGLLTISELRDRAEALGDMETSEALRQKALLLQEQDRLFNVLGDLLANLPTGR